MIYINQFSDISIQGGGDEGFDMVLEVRKLCWLEVPSETEAPLYDDASASASLMMRKQKPKAKPDADAVADVLYCII